MLSRTSRARHNAFTLVELLIVMAIVLVLGAVALPTVRNLLKDGKNAHQARALVAFLNEARSRAIATDSEVGVLIDRLGADNDFVRSASLQMRISNSVPPYAGESAAARALLFYDPPANHVSPNVVLPQSSRLVADQIGPTNAAFFTAADCPLLYLSAINGGGTDQPIGVFDRLELQGGRSVVMTRIVAIASQDSSGLGAGVKVIFDPRERLFDGRSAENAATGATTYQTVAFPTSSKLTTAGSLVSFKIHRKPNLSSVGALTLMKGMAVDLNYSGIGPNGVQFSQFAIAPTATPTSTVDCGPVGIVFAPDGTVSYVNHFVDVSGTVIGSVEHPASNIYLMLGKTDGVRPDSLYDTTSKPVANVMNLEMSWIVINPFSGKINASPAASVDASSLSGGGIGALTSAVFQSRQFAFQSDSLSKF
ncbi:MAG: prepilin-type N-terminal cleavage/methylation domain-containing protein [Rubripirellula sp.]